jgi:hypothetical protein
MSCAQLGLHRLELRPNRVEAAAQDRDHHDEQGEHEGQPALDALVPAIERGRGRGAASLAGTLPARSLWDWPATISFAMPIGPYGPNPSRAA